MIWSLSALCVGFLIDLVLGDPHGVPHPVVLIGKLIGWVEKKARRIFPKTPAGETFAGALLWGIVAAVSTAVPYGILCGCRQISPYLRLAVESVMCWQILAVKSLKREHEGVRRAGKERYGGGKKGGLHDRGPRHGPA
jgi:adenosylcobinamide-phosphate synthase